MSEMTSNRIMEIECKGCYYTVCAFICMTEDISEVLQFLWRHGCVRKSYHCEKCGRPCAIGDKELFFRCNRYQPDEELAKKLAASEDQQQQLLHYNHQQLEQAKGSLQLDLSNLTQSYLMDGGIYPGIGNSISDPEAPGHGDPMVPNIERNYLLANASLIEPSKPQILYSVEAEDIGKFPDSELADLDAESKQHKNGGKKKRCNFKVSMKKGTFFEKSKLPIDIVCKFVALWCCIKRPTHEFLRMELSLAARTVVDWSAACKDVCIHWARVHSEKIGGEGVVVQVDEVKVGNGKYNDENRFSFWGVEKDKENGKLFIVPVRECDVWSLLSVINDWVLPGSVIVSNCWKNYDCLKMPEYVQQTVVQGKTFVHPPNHLGSSNSDGQAEDEGANGSVCDAPMPKFGTRRSHHLGDLAEFMFKRRHNDHLERIHAFFRQVAFLYPLR